MSYNRFRAHSIIEFSVFPFTGKNVFPFLLSIEFLILPRNRYLLRCSLAFLISVDDVTLSRAVAFSLRLK